MIELVVAILFSFPLGEWLGPRTVVVVGAQASPTERAAARRLVDEGAGGTWEVVTDTWVLEHTAQLAQLHLVVVGTPQSNAVLARWPSLWWRTPHPAMRSAFPVQGLYFFGLGDFPRAAGVVECRRSPLVTERAPSDGWPLMVACAGSQAQGAMRAVEALLHNRMLSGVVPDPEGGARPSLPLSLPDDLLRPPPGWVWRALPQALGWHQVDAVLVQTLERRSGTRVTGAWRVVVRPSSKEARPNLHRRITDHEVLVVQTPDSAHASQAVARLMALLGGEGRRQGAIVGTWARGDTVWGLSKGVWVALEHVPGGLELMEALERAIP